MSKDATMDDKTVLRTALATLEGRYASRGLDFDVRVSPCSWMYKGYGLQIEYSAVDGRCHGFLNERTRTVEATTRADIQRLLDTLLSPAVCSTCGAGYLLGEDSKKYRGTLCEPCWMKEFNRRNEIQMEKDRKALARRDANMLKKGYTHRVSAWIHPQRGDDFLLDFYGKGEPTKEDVRRLLQKEGSRVFDDYTVTKLAK